MSWSPPARKTARYALGELLRDSTDHMLMLTATPHKGDPQNFTLFLQLLDPDVYADVTSIRQAMENRRAPFYLRLHRSLENRVNRLTELLKRARNIARAIHPPKSLQRGVGGNGGGG